MHARLQKANPIQPPIVMGFSDFLNAKKRKKLTIDELTSQEVEVLTLALKEANDRMEISLNHAEKSINKALSYFKNNK